MQVDRTTLIIAALAVLLVGTGAFLIGQRSSGGEDRAPAAGSGTIISSTDVDGADETESVSTVEVRALPVRIGRDGPDAGACDRIGHVANLPGGEDEFLSVREAPTTAARRIGKLDDDAPFYVCDRQDAWFGIVYLTDGTLGDPDACGLAEPVGAPRAYSGACLSGWVYSQYVDGSGAQDSDEPSEADEVSAASQTRRVQVSATGSSQAVAASKLAARAEREHGKPVGQRPDGNRVACRETGEGEARWTCSAIYTLTNPEEE